MSQHIRNSSLFIRLIATMSLANQTRSLSGSSCRKGTVGRVAKCAAVRANVVAPQHVAPVPASGDDWRCGAGRRLLQGTCLKHVA